MVARIPQGSAASVVLQQLREKLSQATDTRDGDDDELTKARLKAKAGDAEDLIGIVWPNLRIPEGDPDRISLGRSVRLDDFQMDLINSVLNPDYAEVAVKGNTKAGKGCSMAIAIVLWFYINPSCSIIITSATYDHARKVLYAEVQRWIQSAAVDMRCKVLKETVDGGPKRYIKIANPDVDEAFAGHHSDAVLFVFDEATAIADSRYDLSKTQAHCILAAANPRITSGWFRALYPKAKPDDNQDYPCDMGLRRLLTIDGAMCANVKHKRQIIPGQMDLKRFNSLSKHDDPRWVAVFARGRFPEEDPEKQIILPSWLARHEGYWLIHKNTVPVNAFGLDIAASTSGDETVLVPGGENGARQIHKRKGADTMDTVAWVIAIAREVYGIDLTLGQNPVGVDAEGVGKGAHDRLRELGVWVVTHMGNAPAQLDPRRYRNLRAETYGEFAFRLDPAGPFKDNPFALPPDPMLREELVLPEKIYSSDGIRFRITPKESRNPKEKSLKKLLGRSPDTADGMVLLYLAVRETQSAAGFDTSNIMAAYTKESFRTQLTAEEAAAEKARMHPEVRTLLDFLARPRDFS